MASSMTGYGRGKQENEQFSCTVEIKSVNHRFLDVSVRTPRLYIFLEDGIKSRVTRSVSRGKVDVFLTLEPIGGSDTRIALNTAVTEAYLRCAGVLFEEYAVENDLTASNLMRLPDTFTVERQEADTDALAALAGEAADEALAAFLRARGDEGRRLQTDVLEKLDGIMSLCTLVELRWPQTVEEYRLRLETRMREVLGGVGIEPQRILQEAALYADRIAVDEELVRLKSHGEAMRGLVNESGAIGRKLDFLVQEMGREINTIGSKGNDLEMSRLVVEMKAELEKIREQVQNIE